MTPGQYYKLLLKKKQTKQKNRQLILSFTAIGCLVATLTKIKLKAGHTLNNINTFKK